MTTHLKTCQARKRSGFVSRSESNFVWNYVSQERYKDINEHCLWYMNDYGGSKQGYVNCWYDQKRQIESVGLEYAYVMLPRSMKCLIAKVQILTRYTYRLTFCVSPLHIHWFSMKAQHFYFFNNKMFSKTGHHQKTWDFVHFLVGVFFNRWQTFLWVQSVHLFSPTCSCISRLHVEASQENRKELSFDLLYRLC